MNDTAKECLFCMAFVGVFIGGFFAGFFAGKDTWKKKGWWEHVEHARKHQEEWDARRAAGIPVAGNGSEKMPHVTDCETPLQPRLVTLGPVASVIAKCLDEGRSAWYVSKIGMPAVLRHDNPRIWIAGDDDFSVGLDRVNGFLTNAERDVLREKVKRLRKQINDEEAEATQKRVLDVLKEK